MISENDFSTSEERAQQYFQRTLDLKPIILGNKNIVNNIKALIEFQFGRSFSWEKHSDNSGFKPVGVPKGCLYLGTGETHFVYNVGTICHPENKEKQLHLALRLGYDKCGKIFENYYKWHDENDSIYANKLLSAEIAEFEKAFVERDRIEGENWQERYHHPDGFLVEPPYFMTAIKFGVHGGMLTQDVSEKRTIGFESRYRGVFTQKDPNYGLNKLKKAFLLDPWVAWQMEDGRKYLSEKARYEIN